MLVLASRDKHMNMIIGFVVAEAKVAMAQQDSCCEIYLENAQLHVLRRSAAPLEVFPRGGEGGVFSLDLDLLLQGCAYGACCPQTVSFDRIYYFSTTSEGICRLEARQINVGLRECDALSD